MGKRSWIYFAIPIIEGREDDGGAELAFVDEIPCNLVECVDAKRQMAKEHLLGADVEII